MHSKAQIANIIYTRAKNKNAIINKESVVLSAI